MIRAAPLALPAQADVLVITLQVGQGHCPTREVV
jgi:hypothetical protein